MKPTTLKPGQWIKIRLPLGDESQAQFLYRTPAQGKGRPAINWLRFPDFAGLSGPQDQGDCPISDYDLSRRGRLL